MNSGSINTNYGTSTRLQAGGTYRSYLKFDLAGLASTIQGAKLRLKTVTAGPGVTAHSIGNSTWDETAITSANAPPIGPSLATSRPFNASEWIEVDVTAAVLGNGLLTVALTSTSATALTFVSRESTSNRPQLVVTHVAASPNGTPAARVTANPTAGAVPLAVSFIGSESTDPDGDALSYSWNFGDGSAAATGPTVSHTYMTSGTYTATLTVADGRGGSSNASVEITAGNPPPAPSGTPYASTSFNPVADAQVSSGSLDWNYGTLKTLSAGGWYRSYLKFDLTGLGAPVRKAWLRLYPGTDGLDAHGVADTGWGETTITGRNAPPMGPSVGSSGSIASNDGTQIDVTSLITGNGLVSIGVTSTSPTGSSS